MKRGMPSGAQTPDGIIFLLALIFSKAPPRYPPHHGAHWAYTTSVVRGRERGGLSNFRENLMLAGAGGPDALQTSSPVRRPKLVVSFSACGPPGLTLPGVARQLLNRRSGSARLRSIASQSLLAALRNASICPVYMPSEPHGEVYAQ